MISIKSARSFMTGAFTFFAASRCGMYRSDATLAESTETRTRCEQRVPHFDDPSFTLVLAYAFFADETSSKTRHAITGQYGEAETETSDTLEFSDQPFSFVLLS